MSDDENEEQNVINNEDIESVDYSDEDESEVEEAEPLEEPSSDDEDIVGYMPLAEQGIEEPLVGLEPVTPPPPPALLVPPPINRGITVQPESSASERETAVVTPDSPQGFLDISSYDSIDFTFQKLVINGQNDAAELERLYGGVDTAENRKKSLELLTNIPTSKNTIFINLNLYGVKLLRFNLSKCIFINCVFVKTSLVRANLKTTSFYNCLGYKASFNAADLTDAFIYKCDFSFSTGVDAIMTSISCSYDYSDADNVIVKMKEDGHIPNPATAEAEEYPSPSNYIRDCNYPQALLNFADVSQVDFSRSNMRYASLYKAKCNETIFDSTQLGETNFTKADCFKAEFANASGQQICFNNANLKNVVCEQAKFRHADFRRSDLTHADFTSASLDKSIFTNCTARSIVLNDTSLRECYFMYTNFRNDEDESESSFVGANLTGSLCNQTYFSKANMSSANCCMVKFMYCRFKETDLTKANLHKASFEECDLTRVNLNEAHIDSALEADFRRTGAINDSWTAPTEPPPDEAASCAMTDERAPVFDTLMDYDEGTHLPAIDSDVSESQQMQAAEERQIAAAVAVDEFYWNPALERAPEITLVQANQEEEDDVFTDAAGNRIRLPDAIDSNFANQIITRFSDEGGATMNEFIGNEMVYSGPDSLRFMNFKQRNFSGINFSGTDLTGTNFYGCILQDTKFVGCTLKDTNFQWADLINTDFTNATFEGDYDAGGLLEGATIIFCIFDGATFNAEDKSALYNENTVIQPYDPKAYPPDAELVLPAGAPDTINSNALAYNQEEARPMKIKDYLERDRMNFVFRVVEIDGTYKDYLMDNNYIQSFLVDNKSTVYPCRKQFNVPGPSYPGAGQITYHDIDRPIVNVGNMIQRRLYVPKNKFMEALIYNFNIGPTEPKKGFVFFKNENSETVPTFVSHPVLFNNESWVGNLHCNSGAEREALWYVKMMDITEGVPPPHDGSEGVASGIEEQTGVWGQSPQGVEGESPQAFQGEYVDPFADDSSSESAPASAVLEVVYNPPPDNETVSIPPPEPMDTATVTGLNVRMNPENNTIAVINTAINFSQPLAEPTTSIIISIKNEPPLRAGFTNYILKINDVINLLKLDKKDAMACKTNEPADIVNERRLVNIGALVNKKIYIDKRQLIRLLPNNGAVAAAKRLRSFVLQFNDTSEVLPGVSPLNARLCQGPITVWDFQAWPNTISSPALQFYPGDSVQVSTDINNTLRNGNITAITKVGANYYNGLNGYQGNLSSSLQATAEDIDSWQGIIGTTAQFVMLEPMEDEPPEIPYPILTNINNITLIEDEGASEAAPEEALPIGTLVQITSDQNPAINYTGIVVDYPHWTDAEPVYYYDDIEHINPAFDRIEIAQGPLDATSFAGFGITHSFVQIGEDPVPVLVPTYTLSVLPAEQEEEPAEQEPAEQEPAEQEEEPAEQEQSGGANKHNVTLKKHKYHVFHRNTLRRNNEVLNKTRHHYRFKKYNQLSKRIKHAS
jgi:uncharacterized protein YjbI with pentapeptide repeats